MARRGRMSRGHSRSSFRSGVGTHRYNTRPQSQRGGYRM